MYTNPNIGNPDLAYLFDTGNSKYNEEIKYLPGDDFSKTKVLCKETYAQEEYERLITHFENIGGSNFISKDLQIGEIYKIIITNIDFQDRVIRTEIIGNGIPVFIPFNEFHIDMDNIVGKEYTIIVYDNKSGVYYGSFKKYAQIDYLKEVEEAYSKNTWFNVKILELVDGGYIAEYKETVKCFIPGGQAAPNIIKNFESYIGKVLAVMVDNYDNTSKLYIVSHKKYIRKALPSKIKDIVFGKKYLGTLTSKPTNFGLFVEIDDFFTGLVHRMEFGAKYIDVEQQYKAFDNIDVYVKDITIDAQKRYRIILTVDPKAINDNKLIYYTLKQKYMNRILNFTYDMKDQCVVIDTEDGEFSIPIQKKYITDYLAYGYKHVVIKSIDVIKEKIFLEYMR